MLDTPKQHWRTTNVLTNATGSWHAVFYVAAIFNIVAAVMALVVLKPMRRRAMA